MKRMMVVSDFHCGSDVGLTLPGWDPDRKPKRKPHLWQLRRDNWKWFAEKVDQYRPFDILLVNGDAVDGKGEASGSTECLYPDRNDQVEMAADIIRHIGAKTVLMSYGTAYHTGKTEDWEDRVAKDVGVAKIGSEDTVKINNTFVNYRHHLGRSTIPHGRHTAIARERLWNLLWADRGEYPKADIIIRSHVHYFQYCGGYEWLAVTTPAMQGYGTKFGTRRVTGSVDIGFLVFDIHKDGFEWHPVIRRLGLHKPISL